MMNIILFGPPNCGKGTQAEMVIKEFGLIHLSTGELFRAEAAAGTERGNYVKDIMNRGDLVPDEITMQLIREQFEKHKGVAGFLFDGFPRTLPQKEGLSNLLRDMGTAVHVVISLLVNEDELRTRVTERAKKSGRADDDISVFERRMKNYREQTMPLAGEYRKEGLLREVVGVGLIPVVFARVSGEIHAVEH